MDSIEAGRPPDVDSCSDEDENPALTRVEQEHDQQAVSFDQSQWIPVPQSFRPYVHIMTGRRRGMGAGAGYSMQDDEGTESSHAEEPQVVTRPLLAKLTKDIAETYKICNPSFTCSVQPKPPKRYLTSPSKGVANDGQDNKDADLILYDGCVLVNMEKENAIRYVVKEMLGKGSFGQVCKCSTSDPTYQGDVAVKVIKNHPAYYNQAKVEIGICWRLNLRDPFDKHNIVRILDHFEFAGHLCLVFELLNSNLYELLKLNSHKGLSMKLVKRFTVQILESLVALRDAGVIHCDLKPENILLLSRFEAAEIKLIDFGSACMDSRRVYTYIQSRFYRSPEVLLQLKYTTAIDMWSLGCVAAELFLGLPLFPAACEYDLLRFMIEILGCQPPDHIIHQSDISSKFFKLTTSAPLSAQMATDGQTSAYQFLTEVEFEAREQRKLKVGRRYFGKNKLEDIIVNYPARKKMNQEEIDEEIHTRVAFVDFLKGVLHFDPGKRWTPGQALLHPFLTGEQLLGPYPFRPPPEQIRPHISQWMAMDHNAQTGHWVSGGLSPQVNIRGAVAYSNPGYPGSPMAYNNSYSSAGSCGSYGDGPGLGSSLGSYSDSTGMHHSYSNTPGIVVNGHHHGGAGGFVGSPDTYHHRIHVPNVPTHIGVSPSNYRPVSLGASPSHHHQHTPVSNFYGSPSSNHQFLPSPISYAVSPVSNHHMSPNSQLMLSPGSPSHLSPGRHGPTSPARAAATLRTVAYQNTYRNRHHGSQHEWSRNQHPNANGNDSFMRGPGLHVSQKHRSGAGATHFAVGSSTGFGDGTLGSLLNAADNTSEASEEFADPRDWDPGYSDEQLLGDSAEASSSGVTAMDVSEVSDGMSRLVTETYSVSGQGVLIGHQHGQSISFSGQSRSNGTVQGHPGYVANGTGSGVSPKHSALGQQQLPYSQHPTKHSRHPSSSHLRPQQFMQLSPDASSSTGPLIQTVGDVGNNGPNGHLSPGQRSRLTGASHPGSGMGIPGGAGSNMWPSYNHGSSNLSAEPQWVQNGYTQPYPQNSPHEPSAMNRRSARSLPPTAPGKIQGSKRS